MTQAVQKIQKLINVESFLQIHFVKGYKYVDRAGEIINYFHKGAVEPKFSMSLEGLDIFNPHEKIEAIKISSKTFWAHFLLPDSLEQIDNYFGKKAQDIIKILDVPGIARLGWRNYFVFEFNTEEKRQVTLEKFMPVTGATFENITFTSMCGDVNVIVRLRKVTKNDTASLPGLLFDVDFYEKYEELIGPDQITDKLRKFKEVIRSDEFLVLINDILS